MECSKSNSVFWNINCVTSWRCVKINKNFVNATGNGTFKISVPELANKKLDHQKLLKKIPLTPTFDGNQYQTIPGTTGILVNGTEISNYKSGDVIQFGGVESIDVLGGGSGYDIINPPKITIESLAGIGAVSYTHLTLPTNREV